MKLIINISDESYDKALNGIINCKECFDAIVYGTPLNKIRTEIEAIDVTMGIKDYPFIPKAKVLNVIDKYTKGENT